MKKIIKKICRFIGKIFTFFDRWLITPIMKIVLAINDFIKVHSKSFEVVISSKKALLVISLLVAFLFYYIVDKNANIVITNSAEILYNQPVKAIYNEEAYVVEGLPNAVDVILIGRKSDIYLAKQYPSQEISVDLREFTTGTYKVSLKYRQAISSVEYKIDPSTVTIVIHDKVSSMREVTSEILHRENLDSKLDISEVTLSKSEVTIKGSEKQINAVSYVKALVDVDNLINPVVGTTSVKGVNLVAYNTEGQIVDVEILPSTLDATLKLTSSSKDVPIKIIPTGELALGYAIGSLAASATTITVYGSEASLEAIDAVPVYVDVSGLNANKDFTINITKPNGVREISLKTLTIKLTVDKESQIEIKDVDISIINLNASLKAHAIDAENSKVTVIVKGSSKLLANVDTTKVSAIVDLSRCNSPGEYEVEVQVSGEDLKLSYSSKTTKVKIRIYKE